MHKTRRSAFSLVAFGLFFSLPLFAQIRLAEVAPTNTGQVTDEDGERPDWLEIFNAGATSANLAGLSLSDAERSNQWLLPAIALPPGERLLIFASGKNRGALPTAPTVNHWETAVYESDDWRYTTAQPPGDWGEPGFDDGAWTVAPGGLGYGDGDDATEIPSGTMAVFLRRTFSLGDTAALARALLSIDYDDGFAAYLNGTEIARSPNLPAGSAWNAATTGDHEATLYGGGAPEAFFLEKSALAALLQPGDNVLAVEIHNVEPGSSDLRGRVWLHFGIASAATFFGPVPPWFDAGGTGGGNLHTNFKLNFQETLTLFDANGEVLDSVSVGHLAPGHSRMRANDDGAWCVSASPTPGAPNGSDCLSGYAVAPAFTLTAGFYNGPQTVGLVSGGSGVVHFTTDGAVPDENAPVFAQNLWLEQTTLLRAKRFEVGKLPSPVASATYFINEPTTLPVVSIALDPGDFSAVYDNYSEKGVVNVEYFDQNHQRQFTTPAAGYVVGNWSVAFPQKSLQFDADEEYGSAGEIEYPLFAPDKPIQQFRSFRIRNEDDDWTSARMRDRIVNELARPTHAGQAAFRAVVAFINGEYWGLYSARERLDNYFVRDNYGADPDSVNMVKTHWGQGDYLAEYGALDDFFDLSDFIAGNDMAAPANFAAVGKRLDLDNFTDYFATEIFVASTDWLQDYFNNVRLFRAPDLTWKFLLWDVSYSSGNASGCASCDVLGTTLNDPFGSRYGEMLNGLLGNPEYKRFFINRFADLLNTSFQPGVALGLIDHSATEMAPELNRHNALWGTGDSTYWAWQVQGLKDFYTQRPAYQRQHLIENFNLNGTVDITLQVNPPGAGHVKISTIIPEELPWTGVYFHGNPVTLTAIPAPGYTFENWTNSPFIIDLDSSVFTADVSANATFRANFTGSAQPLTLAVSEINYHSDPTRDAGDWLELHNFDPTPLDLSDFGVRDDQWFHDFRLPTGTVLPPNGRLVLFENEGELAAEFAALTEKTGPLGFALGDKGDEIHVRDAFGDPVETFAYDNKLPWPCTPAGFGRTLERIAPDADPCLPGTWFDGCVGGSPGLPFAPCLENPTVSELNYKSAPALDAGDWLELHNRSATPLDLGGWVLRDDEDNHQFVVPAGVVLPPGGFYVFVQDLDQFAAHFPAVTNRDGPLGFGLSGDGDVVRLYDAAGRLQLSLCYNDAAPWPAAADGEGYTLENADLEGNLNAATNWFTGCYGGSPGVAYDPDCGAVGTGEAIVEESILVFPNPARDFLTVRVSGSGEPFALLLFDVLGKLVLGEKGISGEIRLDLHALPAGIYQLQIETIGGRVIRAVAK